MGTRAKKYFYRNLFPLKLFPGELNNGILFDEDLAKILGRF